MGTEVITCINCTNPATLVNHTQFAGTHHWCDTCVPKEDRDECIPLKQPADPLKQKLQQAMQKTNVQYLLDKLQEEAAEVIQAVSKIRRFGPHNHHPDRSETNLQELTGELEDFQAIVWALEEIKYLDPKPSTTAVIKKYNTLMG